MAVIRRRTNQVARAALELGLQYDGERDVLKGRRAGVSVGAGAAPVVRQLEAELGLRREDALSRSVFRVAAALDPPLDLGLKVEGRGFFSLHEDIFATDHDFEHRYATHVDDPARARALLGPELRRRLVTVAGIWKAWLVDGGVLLESASRPNAAELVALVDAAEAIVADLEERRADLPLPAQIESVIDSWRRQAGELELSLSLNPVRAEGKALRARIERVHARSFEMVVTAAISPPLGLEVRARSTQEMGLAVTSARDVTTGELAFDSVFDAEARDESAFRQAFGAEVRRHLLDLAPAYAVSVDDAGITLRGALGDGEAFGRMCARASEAAALLARRRSASAYR